MNQEDREYFKAFWYGFAAGAIIGLWVAFLLGLFTLFV